MEMSLPTISFAYLKIVKNVLEGTGPVLHVVSHTPTVNKVKWLRIVAVGFDIVNVLQIKEE